MNTTKEDIENWFREGVKQRATHMFVVCDTFSYEDYPVYAKGREKARQLHCEYLEGKHQMQRIIEVYDLKRSMKEQVNTSELQFNI